MWSRTPRHTWLVWLLPAGAASLGVLGAWPGPTLAVEQLATFTLTVARDGAGGGTVASGDGLISCGPDCTASYPEHAAVTLSAAAASDSTFMGWSGSCAGTAPCALTMGAPADVIARFAPTGRDLLVTAVNGPPAMLSPGSSFTTGDTVMNVGSNEAGASVTRYYLSLDAAKSSNDVRLSGSRSVPILGSGMASSGTPTLTVPSSTPIGTYTLLACADDTNVVSEVNGANNCLAAPSALTVALPDLQQTMLSTPPAEATPGSKLTVTDTVTNASAVRAGASTSRFYLSADSTRGVGDLLLASTRSVAALAPGATSRGTNPRTLATTTPVGRYYLLACADDRLKVRESVETNNCIASATTMHVGWPDLATTAVTGAPALVAPGRTVTITDTVSNQGDITAGASTTRYYLSRDSAKDPGDVLLASTRSIAALLPGVRSTGSRVLTIPASTVGGGYRVLACADDLNKVSESTSGNNCGASEELTVNRRPRAHAGYDRDIPVGSTIHIDALASSDGDGDPLSYEWVVLARPAGSGAEPSDARAPSPSILVDTAGQYVLQLIVSDGREASVPDVLIITTGATRFAALGDTGTGTSGQYDAAGALTRACDRKGCAFVVMLGDNIYRSGVTSVSDPQFDTKFEMPYAGVNVPFYVVLGNHDYGGDGDGDEFHKGQFQVDYSAISAKWRMPAAYYRFVWGDVELFGLDTNMQMYAADLAQRDEIGHWLAQSTAQWKIALGHHPYRSNGSHGNAGAYDGTAGVPIISGDGVKAFTEDVVCGRADLLLSGHDHNLQWLRPDGTCEGTELIVSGAGATPRLLRSPASANYNETYFQAAQLGFVYVVVTEHQLTAEFIGADDTVLYVRTLNKAP